MSLKLDIFFIFELGAEVTQTGIQAEYRPFKILILLPTTSSSRWSCPRQRCHRRRWRGSPVMVACLQVTVAAVLTSLATMLLGILVGGDGGEGVLVLARPRPVLLLPPFPPPPSPPPCCHGEPSDAPFAALPPAYSPPPSSWPP
jgi:hypothetical protein